MKSKTSFFNPTIFKKDVTRFAPAWGLYSLMLVLYLLMTGNFTLYSRAVSVADMIGPYAAVMGCYALIVVHLLFGDLYNPRMCNAIHAMPPRRECLFVTHVAAGMAFALVPNAVITLVSMPLLGGAWSVAAWWLLGTTLEYLFFFGLALFCAMCVGNRFAMALVYGIINFLSMLAYWFVDTLYEPLLTGVRFLSDPFIRFCPFVQMCNSHQLVDVLVVKSLDQDGTYVFSYNEIDQIVIGEGWSYLAICAVIGAVLVGLALLLYRRRKLESAGDFMAVRVMEPVFLVLYTLTFGCLLHLCRTLFGVGSGNEYWFLAIGIAAGFFTGLMLLRRTTRVFRPKAFLGLGVLGAVVALSLVLTSMDVLGITRIVPDKSEIASIRFGESYSYNSFYLGSEVKVTDEADFDNILYVHRYGIGEITENLEIEGDTLCLTDVGIEYTLTDGTILNRYYSIPVPSTAGRILGDYYSRPEVVLDVEVPLEELADRIYYIACDSADGHTGDGGLDAQSLIDAIIADCEAGNMIQLWEYQNQSGTTEYTRWLNLDYRTEDGEIGTTIRVFDSCENTLRWLVENGLTTP